jgi:hypothetical protein
MHYWMEGVRHEIEALEAAVGTRLFHFGKPGYPSDDDEGHRFLALDRICYVTPNSRFVEYRVEVAEAPSVQVLRAALRARWPIRPTSVSLFFPRS